MDLDIGKNLGLHIITPLWTECKRKALWVSSAFSSHVKTVWKQDKNSEIIRTLKHQHINPTANLLFQNITL